MDDRFLILAGTANPDLAGAIAHRLGLPLCARDIERFPDGEVAVEIQDPVRGREVFLVQPTSPPVDLHLMELLALTDACRRAAASRIVAVIPYFGYARADRRMGRNEALAARMVADLLQAVGVQQVVVVDLHTAQAEGFFTVPVDTLTAAPVLCEAIGKRLPPDVVVVSPDTGRVRMAADYAQRLRAPAAILHKRRIGGSQTEAVQLAGDVRGRACLIVDDMITTGGTIAASVKALRDAGARSEFHVAATHGLFVGDARARLEQAGVDDIWVTDTVVQDDRAWPALHVVSAAPLIADALAQIGSVGPLSDMY